MTGGAVVGNQPCHESPCLFLISYQLHGLRLPVSFFRANFSEQQLPALRVIQIALNQSL